MYIKNVVLYIEKEHIAAFMQRMAERPEVQDALSAEGLK